MSSDRLDIYLHLPGAQEFQKEVLEKLNLILTTEGKMTQQIDAIKAAVDSVDAAIEAAEAKLAAGGLSAADQATLAQATSDLIAHRDALNAALNPPAATAPPVITSITPVTGPVGTQITVSGTGFGATQGSSTVSYGGTPVTPSSWSDTTIVFTVPTTAAAGANAIVVTEGGQASNSVSFAGV